MIQHGPPRSSPVQGTLTALSQAAAAADHAASSALFAEYRRQLAACTRRAHHQDLARCALYLAHRSSPATHLRAGWSCTSTVGL